MTKSDIKHIDELGKASRIIKELGYEPDESMRNHGDGSSDHFEIID